MTLYEQSAPASAGLVYEYSNPLGSPATAMMVQAVPHPATEGHMTINGGEMPALSDLTVEQVAGLEATVIKGALLAQAVATHMAETLPGAGLIYRMRRTAGSGPYVEHLVPRYPSLGEAGDPMLTIDPYLMAHNHGGPSKAVSKYAFSPRLTAKTDTQLALVDALYGFDYAAFGSDRPTPPPQTGTDVLDKIQSGEIKARVVYQDDDLSVFVDRNPGTNPHVVAASRECVDSWWKLPPETVAKMAITGLYFAWHMQRQHKGSSVGAVNFLTAAYQIHHPHDHIAQNQPHQEFMKRMSPKSPRMSEKHTDAELDAVRDAMTSEELVATLDARLRHATGFFALMRAIATPRQ